MTRLLFTVTILLLVTLSFISATKVILKDLVVPPQAHRNRDVLLYCHYDLQNQTLESISWFFNSSEIYRYTHNQRNKQNFASNSVEVDLPRSNQTILALKNMQLESTGFYKCSISTDYPDFDTTEREKFLEVVVIPEEKPKLEGVPDEGGFTRGMVASINCTSAPSKPASKLTFQVNGKIISKNHIKDYPVEETDDGLFITKATLLLKYKTNLFNNDELDLACFSRIKTKEKLAVLAVIKSSGTVMQLSLAILIFSLTISLRR